jgi:hypothetical protein
VPANAIRASLHIIRVDSRAVEAAARLSSASPVRLKVVPLEIVGDLPAEHGPLRVGSAKVDAGPHSSVDYLFEYV